MRSDEELLAAAIEQAEIGLAEGGIPIGAVLAVDGEVVGAGHNQRVQLGSAIRHGETDALEQAGSVAGRDLRRSTMYTTLSPCNMCTGAILLYGIPRVVIGENRTFLGAEDLLRAQRRRGGQPRLAALRRVDDDVHRRAPQPLAGGHRRSR